MFCKVCGTELNDANFCPKCGAPVRQGIFHTALPIISGIADPNVLFRTAESKVFGAISSFVLGALMVSGGIYGIFKLTYYTEWVIVGSAFTILGGIGCLIKCIDLVSKLVSQSKKGE